MRVELHAATRASEARLDQTDARFDRIDARLDQMDARFDRIDTRLDGMDTRIETSAAETRRHMEVLAEGLTSKIALVAEGVVTLTERLSAEMHEGFESLDRRVMWLETRLFSGERG